MKAPTINPNDYPDFTGEDEPIIHIIFDPTANIDTSTPLNWKVAELLAIKAYNGRYRNVRLKASSVETFSLFLKTCKKLGIQYKNMMNGQNHRQGVILQPMDELPKELLDTIL